MCAGSVRGERQPQPLRVWDPWQGLWDSAVPPSLCPAGQPRLCSEQGTDLQADLMEWNGQSLLDSKVLE